MDEDFLWTIIFLGVIVIGALGSILWWVFVIWLAGKAMSSAQKDLDRLFGLVANELDGFSALPPEMRASHLAQAGALLGQVYGQLQVNPRLGQANSLHRQRYETYVGDIQNMAISAGFTDIPTLPRY